MTHDATKPVTEERYRLTITNLGGVARTVRCYDLLTDKTVPVIVRQRGKGTLVVEVTVTDYPRLLEIGS